MRGQTHRNSRLKNAVVALAIAAGTMCPAVSFAQAVPIDVALIGQISTGCAGGGDACDAAIEGVLAQLGALNPGVDPELILASLVAAVSEAYNAGSLPAAVTVTSLSSIQTAATVRGATNVLSGIATALASASAGNAITVAAVAQGAVGAIGAGGEISTGGSGLISIIASRS